MPIDLAALFLLIFRYIFGGPSAPALRSTSVNFLVPGFLVTTVFWTGTSSRRREC
jgi:hypothetical protein